MQHPNCALLVVSAYDELLVAHIILSCALYHNILWKCGWFIAGGLFVANLYLFCVFNTASIHYLAVGLCLSVADVPNKLEVRYSAVNSNLYCKTKTRPKSKRLNNLSKLFQTKALAIKGSGQWQKLMSRDLRKSHWMTVRCDFKVARVKIVYIFLKVPERDIFTERH
mgnify:CR=1 FL=1